MHSRTPLARWLNREHRSVNGLAKEIEISRARLYLYLNGRSFPADPVVRQRLKALSGLSDADLQPLRRARIRGRKVA